MMLKEYGKFDSFLIYDFFDFELKAELTISAELSIFHVGKTRK